MIIVGAGIIGLSCAWRLAQKGVPVMVFDAREAAREASWAGAGMLAPGGEVESDSEAARMAVRSLASYPRFVEELRNDTGASIDFRRCGGVELAFTQDEAAALETKAALRAGLGIPSEAVEPPAAIAPGALAARLYPGDSIVDPREVTAALMTACRALGVVFHEYEPVIEVFEEGAVRTKRGEYRDHAVLIAAGAWSSELLVHASVAQVPKTMPVRGHLMAYRAQPGLLGPIYRHGHTYLLQRSSGTLIAGSSTEQVGFDRRLDPMILSDIQSRAERLLPALASLQPVEQWNGLRPGIEAEGPMIGRVAENLWGAFGHYRNGILLAPETATLFVNAWQAAR